MKTYSAKSPARVEPGHYFIPHELRYTPAPTPEAEAAAYWDAVGYDQPWTSRAACLERDPETWFPAQDSSSSALETCRACPVLGECRAYARELHVAGQELYGVWGGTTRTERKLTWTRRPA